MASIFRRKYTLQDNSVLFSKWTFDPDLPLLQIRYRLIDTYTIGSTVYVKHGAFSNTNVNLMPPAAIVLTANVVEQVTQESSNEVDNREYRVRRVWTLVGGGTTTTYGAWASWHPFQIPTTDQLPDAPHPTGNPFDTISSSEHLETRGSIDTVVTPPTYRRRHEYDNGALVLYGPTQPQSSPASPATPVAMRTTDIVNVAPETSVVESRTLDNPMVTTDDYLYLVDRSNGELRVFTWPGRERDEDRDIDVSDQATETHGIVSNGEYVWLLASSNIGHAYLLATETYTSSKNIALPAGQNIQLRGGMYYNGTLWLASRRHDTVFAVNASTLAQDTSKNLSLPALSDNANACFNVGNIGWVQARVITSQNPFTQENHWYAFNLDTQARLSSRDIEVTGLQGEGAFTDGTYGYAIQSRNFRAIRLSDGVRVTAQDFSIPDDEVGALINGASRFLIQTTVSTQYRRVDTYEGGLRIVGAWGIDAEPAANPVLMIASHELETAPMVGPRAIL